MLITELERYLSTLFDPGKMAAFPQEHGFTVRGRPEIRRIGYAVNLNLETAEKAVSAGVDLLITHHDAWEFIIGMKEACRRRLEQGGVSHYFIHAPLDDADFGTNATLLSKLGAGEKAKSNLYEGVFYAGRVGEYPEPLSLKSFVKRVEQVLEEPVRTWRHNDRPVKRICLVAGGGSMTGEVKAAVDLGCDTYITGEMGLYTLEYARFTGINLVIGSHTFTEIFGVENLARKVGDRFEVEVIPLKEEHREAFPDRL